MMQPDIHLQMYLDEEIDEEFSPSFSHLFQSNPTNPFCEELQPFSNQLHSIQNSTENQVKHQHKNEPEMGAYEENKLEQSSSSPQYVIQEEFDIFPRPLHPENQKNILCSIQDKLDEKEDSRYGNDEICKKIIRKVVECPASQFHRKCEDEDKPECAQHALLQFLKEKGYEGEITLHEMKILKMVLYPLRLKRKDPVFGNKKERGQKSRNDFLNKGTKKAALEFFKYPSTRFLFWGDFEEGVKNSADLLKQQNKSSHEKLVNLLERLMKKLVRTLSI